MLSKKKTNMARRKKPGQSSGTRRSARRAKEQQPSEGATTETEVPPIIEPTDPVDPATEHPEDLQPKTDLIPTGSNDQDPTEQVATLSDLPTDTILSKRTSTWHKHFGKFRFLLNTDDNSNKNSSDSETNSSIEIRVVDPCASSESDSNAALDTNTDMGSITHLSPTNSTNSAIQPVSPSLSMNPESEVQESTENVQVTPMTDTEMITANDIACMLESANESQTHSLLVDPNDLEEEIITVVQIVEDDNQEMYYDIKIDSPKQSQTVVETIEINNEEKADVSGFQKNFEMLNLTDTSETSISYPTENTRLCTVTEIPFLNESSADVMLRPDPSITPSSTLSDDSNSSKVPFELNQQNSNDSAESSPTAVRRSNRIKTISTLKQKTKGYGLVKTPLKKALMSQTKLKLEELGQDSDRNSKDDSLGNSPAFPVPSDMPVKVKSRWRRSSELEMNSSSPVVSPLASPGLPQRMPAVEEDLECVSDDLEKDSALTNENCDKIIEERMSQYQHLDENEYLCDRMISRDAKKMICDCFITKEELERGELGCGEDCLNRLLMIECNCRCPVGDRCTNRRFQKRENGPLRVFYADKKGCGVEAGVDIPSGEFLMEYVGEVLDYEKFYERAQAYSAENNLHHYFMSLKGETVIDATMKGNISRFINHSCDPNAETQKWTVNGELRIGFFSKRDIKAAEEITFDYQFQRFGKVAQRCYCGTENCRGWIGAEPDSEDEEEEEEEEDDVSTSKAGAADASATETEGGAIEQESARPPRPKRASRPRRRYAVRPATELQLDADIEDDVEALSRTGIKNQSHTLLLSRIVLRAKGRRAQTSLLRLLRDADLPCRRLFLDYRGLRLLAPWCNDAPLDFRLEMLLTVDRLPIPNKTMVQESRFFTTVERWLSSTSEPQPPVFIDEATGLPVDIPTRVAAQDAPADRLMLVERVKELSKQLLERWSSLKEVFKIPKKERIQQMKEHERQANVERRAADSSGSRDRDRERERERRDEREHRERERERERDRDRERERERYKERERERERERDRERERERERDDRDRRKRRTSPEGRRSIRLNERVLASVPPMTKEERRRAFAEAAAVAENTRRQTEQQRPPSWPQFPQWPTPDAFPPQMFPPGMMGGVPGGPGVLPPGALVPPGVLGVVPDAPSDWLPTGDFPAPPPFCPPFFPQHNFLGMGGFPMGGFMYPPQLNAAFPPQPPPALDAAVVCVKPEIPVPERPPEVLQQQQQQEEVELPSQWRSARDARGRTYYYHVKLRIPQWQPPPPPHDVSSEEEEPERPPRQQRQHRHPHPHRAKGKLVEGVHGIYEVIKEPQNGLIPDHALVSKARKRRPGLVTERPISPRTEEDKLAGRLEVKRYRETKEKLRKRREKLLQRIKLLEQKPSKRPRIRGEIKVDELTVTDSESDTSEECEEVVEIVEEPVEQLPEVDPAETARRIKEEFRCSMARVMVQHLNPYRHPAAPVARITCTADFKHLARKLTHFVLLKELRHCRAVEDLVCTDSVRAKAKEFVKKYMAKFGPVYHRPAEEAD